MTDAQAAEPTLLKSLLDNVHQAFQDDRTILSYSDYFAMLLEHPERHLRTSAQYVVDMFHHYGIEKLETPVGEITRYKLFDMEGSEGEWRVAGHEAVQDSLYRIFANFAREGRINKLVLLHGPNGSAKSSLVRALMASIEDYARQPEGALYSFNWIFPTPGVMGQDRIGFGAKNETPEPGRSYASLAADQIDARVPCEMHDHPLFLLPQGERASLFRQLLPDSGIERPESQGQDGQRVPTTSVSDYLRHGDLCYKCRRIYDALLASYDGDAQKVLNHVQIERFYLSRRYRRGLATIEPQASVDARIHQVTADRSLAALPRALQHTSLFEPTGPLVDANRGLLEFSDLLKRPVEAFKYLLATVETATVSMESFVLHLDMLYIASTNETYLDAFKQHPDFTSFKGRMELLKVPYLLRYRSECEIYESQITARVVGRHIAPHAMKVAALWAVLTRMRRCDPARYSESISKVIDSITPLEKLRLYDTGEPPERLSTREAQELVHIIPDLYAESLGYPNYEGRFGASAREIRTALLNAAHHSDYKCLSPLAVLAEIRDVLNTKGVYDFLKQEVVSGYHDHAGFLEQTEGLFLRWVDDEIRESMGLTTDESYVDLFERYVNHVTHWVKSEKMLDERTGRYVDPNENFMAGIEQVLMAEGEKKDDFRRGLIGTIGARSLEDPDNLPAYSTIFRQHMMKLREDFFARRSKVIQRINGLFLDYTSEEGAELEAKDEERVKGMLETLETRYGYCVHCARDTVAYLQKKRYNEL